jgi:hypothetical protein
MCTFNEHRNLQRNAKEHMKRSTERRLGRWLQKCMNTQEGNQVFFEMLQNPFLILSTFCKFCDKSNSNQNLRRMKTSDKQRPGVDNTSSYEDISKENEPSSTLIEKLISVFKGPCKMTREQKISR